MVVVVLALVDGGVVLAWSAIHTLSVTRDKMEKYVISRSSKLETHQLRHKNTFIVVPLGLRSFPGMYASSLISEKVTVAPPTSKEAGLIQR